MGLDATVYCDCFEQRRLRTMPQSRWNVLIAPDGSRSSEAEELAEQLAFDQWNIHACEHEDGVLLHHRIGNIGLVAFLHDALAQSADRFPLILSRIIYSGSHCGDCIEVDRLQNLHVEIQALSDFHVDDPEDELWVREFEIQLSALVDAARRVGKPISF